MQVTSEINSRPTLDGAAQRNAQANRGATAAADAFSRHLKQVSDLAHERNEARAEERRAAREEEKQTPRNERARNDEAKTRSRADEAHRKEDTGKDRDPQDDTVEETDEAAGEVDQTAETVQAKDAGVDGLFDETLIQSDKSSAAAEETAGEETAEAAPDEAGSAAGLPEQTPQTDTQTPKDTAGDQTAPEVVTGLPQEEKSADAADQSDSTQEVSALARTADTASTAKKSEAAPGLSADRTLSPAKTAETAQPDKSATSQTATQAAAEETPDAQAQTADGDPSDGETDKKGKGLGHELAAKMASRKTGSEGGPAAADPQANRTVPRTNSVPAAATMQAQTVAATTLSSKGAATFIDPVQQINANPADAPASQSTQNSNPVLVRAAALPNQAQATQIPMHAVALHIARHLEKGINRFEIRLDPPELGRIDVRLEVSKDGKVRAHLVVDKAETLDMLQRDARALERALSDAGLDADGDALNFSLRDDNASGSTQEDWPTAGEQITVRMPEEEEAQPVYRPHIPGLGRLDIRI